ncbi:hypothetical protein LR48_Vigan01g015000 [Vigna angularis]|uniref:C3H1-type domain-containing protein n=2 Tax=Phaseolus angularis TaxID=3914 RepID=A0A0L9TJE9_PHAAN|nr:hypothetical protein LR48_Vigan01g015000 [Vigna angularis]
MSGTGRNTSSKLDSGDGPEFASYGTTSSNNSNSSYLERNDNLNPRMGFSNEESFSGGRCSNKDGIVVSKDDRVSDAQNTDGSNKMELSPVNEDLKNKYSQSPKTGCSRSDRSSSPSPNSSPSRSRSRSPRNFRWDSRTSDRCGMRAACRYFPYGKCRRGSKCLFLHGDNKKIDDSRVSSRRQDGSLLYSSPSGRSKGTCINYANGRCRMGESCKYMHHENSSKFNKTSMDESTGEMEIDRRCRGSSFEEGGRNQRSDIPCKFYPFGNCRYGKDCRFSHDRQASGSPSRGFKDDLLRSSDGDQALDRPESSEVSLHGKLMDDGEDLDGSVAGADNKKGIMVDPEPGFNTLPVGDERGHSLDKNTVHGESTFSSEVKEAKSDSSNVHTCQSVGNEKMSHNWNYGVTSPIPIKEEHEQSKQQVTPEQVIHQNVNVSHSSSCEEVGQSQLAPSTVPPSVRTIESVQNQEVFAEKKQTSGANMDANIPQVGSGNAPIENVTREERLAQLTNLSVSLLQILGAILHLPQIFAPSVSLDAKSTPFQSKTEESGNPVSITSTKPGPAVRLLKPRDPRRKFRESMIVNEKKVVPTISPSQNITEDTAEIPSLLSDSQQHFDESKKSAFSEEQLVKSEHSIELQKGKNVEDSNEKNKMVAEGKPNSSTCEPEDAKTVKDVKGIDAFKFELVEFVKELLDPTWKCGKIKKEDYKAIVKKVADKVTDTVQPPYIPQTKEQIDRYLSISKTKIDKLVQAYVEKFQKA